MSDYKIHSLADVQSQQIGAGTSVWQYVVILPEARIGSNCNINAFVFIENDVIIGDNVTVKSGVQIWDGVRLEDNVFIGPNVTFTNDLFPRSKVRPPTFQKTYVSHHASIGANATIIAGVTIGEYALIGAGSIVTRDVPAFGLVYGNPARLRGYICSCGTKNPVTISKCRHCGSTLYDMVDCNTKRNDALKSQ